ncbi:hypothetical protein E2320_013774, partial [Naja naja]
SHAAGRAKEGSERRPRRGPLSAVRLRFSWPRPFRQSFLFLVGVRQRRFFFSPASILARREVKPCSCSFVLRICTPLRCLDMKQYLISSSCTFCLGRSMVPWLVLAK